MAQCNLLQTGFGCGGLPKLRIPLVLEASKLPFDPFIGPKNSQIRRVPRGPYESGGFRRHILGQRGSLREWLYFDGKSFPRVLTGYFPVFVVLEFRKSSDENVEMTNIDFVVLEFRKSSSALHRIIYFILWTARSFHPSRTPRSKRCGRRAGVVSALQRFWSSSLPQRSHLRCIARLRALLPFH